MEESKKNTVPAEVQSKRDGASKDAASREALAKMEQEVANLKSKLAAYEPDNVEYPAISDGGPPESTFVVTQFGHVYETGPKGPDGQRARNQLRGPGCEVKMSRKRALEINQAGPYLVEKR